MPKNKPEDAFFFDAQAEGAFKEVLETVLIFINTLRDNAKSQATNNPLNDLISPLFTQVEDFLQRISSAQVIMPNMIKKFSNELNRATDLLHNHRFESDSNKLINIITAFLAQTKRLDAYHTVEKQTEEIQKRISSVIDHVHSQVQMILSRSRLKDKPILEKYTEAVTHFLNECRRQIFGVFKKADSEKGITEKEIQDVKLSMRGQSL